MLFFARIKGFLMPARPARRTVLLNFDIYTSDASDANGLNYFIQSNAKEFKGP